MPVYRTFSEGQERADRSYDSWLRGRLVPARLIHAAEHDSEVTLCGKSTRELIEFGRSRHAFERTETDARCPSCQELAVPAPDPWSLPDGDVDERSR
jgi:hypothetical protein